MITLLTKLLIRNGENTDAPEVRKKYGVISGGFGIFLNILLFSMKLAVGLSSGSISIIADAFNNLSDAGSSVITMIGFRIAAHEADRDHPFGHGRSEYISGLIVSVIILVMAIELIRSSVSKILHPEKVDFTPAVLLILVIGILIKLYMYYYNKSLGTKIASAALRATATDSLSDALATFAVLLSTIVGHLSGLHIDGWCGVFVGILILLGGIQAARDTIGPLLGQAPDPAFIKKIQDIVGQYDQVLDMHDLIVHDYGPGRRMISLHAEVPATGDILALHDTIDVIEKRLQRELNCSAVIHMDPVMNDDAETIRCHELMAHILAGIDKDLTLHDFRIVKGPTHTNLIFDLVVPYHMSCTVGELKDEIERRLQQANPCYYAVMQIDHPS